MAYLLLSAITSKLINLSTGEAGSIFLSLYLLSSSSSSLELFHTIALGERGRMPSWRVSQIVEQTDDLSCVESSKLRAGRSIPYEPPWLAYPQSDGLLPSSNSVTRHRNTNEVIMSQIDPHVLPRPR
ncbi:hypothetical protein Dimus_038327 [Dionaea muscipula]